mmetsp:Transcript_123501/g.184727  ORF Transcript_123501/g.184727 Transcript_123501/m.184727 type:complete len:227 (-) Transcript_123501:1664-2344(-)
MTVRAWMSDCTTITSSSMVPSTDMPTPARVDCSVTSERASFTAVATSLSTARRTLAVPQLSSIHACLRFETSTDTVTSPPVVQASIVTSQLSCAVVTDGNSPDNSSRQQPHAFWASCKALEHSEEHSVASPQVWKKLRPMTPSPYMKRLRQYSSWSLKQPLSNMKEYESHWDPALACSRPGIITLTQEFSQNSFAPCSALASSSHIVTSASKYSSRKPSTVGSKTQ